ncbi:MAG: CIA30 family protein [Comamonadaceae bacterium CG1_02_60_18]|nr:MAG: CIA30 family protein [Comamonadaceae bacterium CG1_02_60_18]PIQ53984.1 MAG: CIA30 family protein [Comamonadaceae bacterium CG12_big_fil_rev_8_21_14_0_65_59_15]
MKNGLLFDTVAAVDGWRAIDDRVMGGVSSSRMVWDAARFAIFTGSVSLQNNGGFASVRLATNALATPDVRAYCLRVRGDGKRYKLNLRTDSGFDGVNYQATFAPPPGQWCDVTLTLGDFAPSFRGHAVPDAPTLEGARVCQVGLMIAEQQAGEFRLALESILIENQ